MISIKSENEPHRVKIANVKISGTRSELLSELEIVVAALMVRGIPRIMFDVALHEAEKRAEGMDDDIFQ